MVPQEMEEDTGQEVGERLIVMMLGATPIEPREPTLSWLLEALKKDEHGCIGSQD